MKVKSVGKKEDSLLRKTSSLRDKITYMKRDTKDNIQYWILLSVPLILMFIFHYLPIFGIVISFQEYMAGRPFFGEGVKWVGLKWFKEFVSGYYFPRIVRNTLMINIKELFITFWVPIIFAVILSEVKNSKFKKITQTVSYMPHFISAVVLAGIVKLFLSDEGILTYYLRLLGIEANGIMMKAEWFQWILVFTRIWAGFGWGSILYLSTITAIDPGLYGAAAVDGAGRLRRIWHITLPCLRPLITIQLIMFIGGMMSESGGLTLLLYNQNTMKTADVLDTYLYRETIQGARYSLGAAAGQFMSLINFVLLVTANRICAKFTDYSMW